MKHSKAQNLMKKLFVLFAITLPMVTAAKTVTFFPTEDTSKAVSNGLLNSNANTALALGGTPTTIAVITLINTALSLLALLCLAMLLYGGFLFVWARGNAETLQKAKDILQGTIIGLILIVASLGIVTFVFTQLASITGATIN